MSGPFRNLRPPAVAGAFYPADPRELADMIDAQLAYARTLLGNKTGRRRDGMIDAQLVYARTLPGNRSGDRPDGMGEAGKAEASQCSRPMCGTCGTTAPPPERSARPWPKAIIVPHAGYVYSGTTAALAYALLAPGRGTIRRAVIVGPTHRVAVRGVACATYDAFRTPLGVVPVDVASECRALGLVSPSRNTAATLPDAGGRDVPAAVPPLRSGMTAAPGAPALIVNDPTHAQEHAVEVQIPFLQRVLGDIEIVPLNAGLATSRQVGDVLRAFWGGPETVIVISSDLSHYHRERIARHIDDETIRRITALDYPIDPDLACGAYPINGILDVIARGVARSSSRDSSAAVVKRTATGTASSAADSVPVLRSGASDAALRLEFLGCSTSGDDGVVALAGQKRPAMADPDDRVVGYAAWAVWEESAGAPAVPPSVEQGATSPSSGEIVEDGAGPRMADVSSEKGHGVRRASSSASRGTGHSSLGGSAGDGAGPRMAESCGDVLLDLVRASLRAHLGLPVGRTPAAIVAAHPWLNEPGASFVTLNEHGDLRGCIGTLEAYRPLGRDVAEHAVDAAARDPRFPPVTPDEYPSLDIEVSVLSPPEPIMVAAAADTDTRGGNPDNPSGRDSLRPVRSRAELERALRPGRDGLIIEDRPCRHRATFLPQVWEELPEPRRFVAHLLAKAGLSASTDWRDGEIRCSRYAVTAYQGRADA